MVRAGEPPDKDNMASQRPASAHLYRNLPLSKIIATPDRLAILEALEEIFFETASQSSFASQEKRTAFRQLWLSYYLDKAPENVYLALAPRNRLAGYLTGCTDSRGALSSFDSLAYYRSFLPLYDNYPAHFHVNVASAYRNQGIGSALVETFRAHCRDTGVCGIHAVTNKDARNVAFYRRCGLEPVSEQIVDTRPLVLLGQRLC